MLVPLIELVAHERRHARLDPARAERDQRQPDVKSESVRDEHREARLPRAINQAEPEDRVVLSKEPVRHPSAEQRKKVNADDEGVKNLLRRARAIASGK